MLFLSNNTPNSLTNVFPFAFNPENVNARKVDFESKTRLTVSFDMQGKEVPECAAVAVIFNQPSKLNNLKFKITNAEGDQINIICELKTVQNGQLNKFCEKSVNKDGELFFENIPCEVKEVVFCCWRSMNKDKKGIVFIDSIE